MFDVIEGAGVTSSSRTLSRFQKSVFINDLTPNTYYSFSISFSDTSRNQAQNNPFVLNVKTAVNTSTERSGSTAVASQGSFSVGY
jgi:hypothetical protein